jgi:hypothetical protein
VGYAEVQRISDVVFLAEALPFQGLKAWLSWISSHTAISPGATPRWLSNISLSDHTAESVFIAPICSPIRRYFPDFLQGGGRPA